MVSIKLFSASDVVSKSNRTPFGCIQIHYPFTTTTTTTTTTTRVKRISQLFDNTDSIGKRNRFRRLSKTQNPPKNNNQILLLCNEKYVDIQLEDALAKLTPDSTAEHCNLILRQLEQCSDTKTLTLFQWMRSNGKLKQNLAAYNYVFRVLGRNKDWEAAEKLLREVIIDFGPQLNFQLFNTLIYACYKRGLPKLGTKWLHLMLDHGVHPNIATFGMLMSLYQKGGNVEEAEFAFRRMRILNLKCQSAYSAMITIYTRLGLYDKSEMIIALMEEDNLVPNSDNWLVQINAYSQQGKLVEAESVFKSMLKAGFPPNIVAYNTLITGYGKVSDMDSAERVFQKLQTLGLEPDETTYRSMVEGWGRADGYLKAKYYYEELKKSGSEPNSSNMYTMLNLQARHGDEEGALETLGDMRRTGCQYSSTLSSLLQAYEKVERVDRVPLLLKGSFYEHLLADPTSCSILVLTYVKRGMIDDALQLLQEKHWNDVIFQDNLYHLLICSCKEMGLHEEAIKIFSRMPKSDANPNLHITCTMIDIYSSIGRYSEAKGLYLKLVSCGIALDMITYSVVVRMYVKAGCLKDACAVLETMEEQKDIIPDTFLFRDMLRIYQRCNLQDKLSDLYFKLLKREIVWDEEMYNCVINCCARALPVDELTRIFDEMLERGFSPNTVTFNVMLNVYGKERLLKKARKVFWMARTRGVADVISYNTMIAAYGQSKDFTNMRATVKKMEFSGLSVSLEVYNSMLDAYGKDSQMDKFKSVLKRLKESSVMPDQYTCSILINIYGEQGWIEEVAGVLSEFKERGVEPNLHSYNTLIKAYGIAGMVEEAVDVVKGMRDNGIEPDHITYVNLVHALQRNDNFLEAVKWSLWMKQMGMPS